MVRNHVIFAEKIVAVFVADRNAETVVVFQNILLEKAMADTPAEEKAVLPVATRGAAADDRALRATSGMEAEAGVIFADAIFDQDIVGLLEADAITVEISRSAVFNHGAKSAVKKDAGAVSTTIK